MGKSIVITSGKGGTGKTTTAAALSEALALMGKRVLCVDCDVGLKNLDLALGVTDKVLWDFGDILAGRVSARDAVLHHEKVPGLDFLSAPADLTPENIDEEGFSALRRTLEEDYDFVLYDSPAGLGRGFRLASQGSQMAIVVSTADSTSLRDGQKTVSRLAAWGIKDIRLLINRVQPRNLRRVRTTVDDIIDVVGAQLIGIVSEDEAVSLAMNLEEPLMVYDSDAAVPQYKRIARRICGERVFLGRF